MMQSHFLGEDCLSHLELCKEALHRITLTKKFCYRLAFGDYSLKKCDLKLCIMYYNLSKRDSHSISYRPIIHNMSITLTIQENIDWRLQDMHTAL